MSSIYAIFIKNNFFLPRTKDMLYAKNEVTPNIFLRVKNCLSSLTPKIIDIFVFLILAGICFYLYTGFQTIYITITQDNIPGYIASKYILSHPFFTFAFGFPRLGFLGYLLFSLIQLLTNDTQWLNVVITLSIHIINAFILFKITQVLTKNKLFPSLIASLFFLASPVHIDSILSFPHSGSIINCFFGLLSIYFFFKVLHEGKNYKRKDLYFSFLCYLLSIAFGEQFIGLALFFFVIMLFKIKKFKKDFVNLFIIVVVFYIGIFLIKAFAQQVYNIDNVSSLSLSSLSVSWLVQKIKNYNYSFLHLTSLFFPRFPTVVASFFHETKNVLENVSTYHNRYFPGFSLFVIFIPLAFFKKERILKLYSLLILMYLLFIPYLFCQVPLAARHFSQTVVASCLFLGLLFYYLFESIGKIKVNLLQKALNLLLILFLGIFFLKYMVIVKGEVKQYIAYQASFSPFIEKFTEEFKKIKAHNTKKQIYFLKNEIPKKYTFMNSTTALNYAIFYYAVKYKKLPVDLYLDVYSELECGKFNPEICENYFISLSDGSCFALYRDKDKLRKLIDDNSYITLQDVIVLNWDGGLKQESF